MFLASLWLEIDIDFQISHFANFEQFKVDIYFANIGKSKLILFGHFYYFGQVAVILLSLGKTCL